MENNIKEIIVKVFDGSATIEERKELQTWARENGDNTKELEQYEGIWDALEIIYNKNKFDAENGYNTFLKTTKVRVVQRPVSFILRIAATIALLISFTYLIWHYMQTNNARISYFEILTSNGSHSQVTLTDGTTVWLNAGSKLRYPNKFEGKTRTVYLEGEAFFKVKKDPTQPFIVKTSEVDVKALGTSFNVKAYPNEGSIETTLIEGIVIVGNNKKEQNTEGIKLQPGERATFIKTTGRLLLNDHEQNELKKASPKTVHGTRETEKIIVSQEVNTELYTSWIDNKLFFDNETFESIAFKLERRYGATIIFMDNKVKTYRFSGKFPEISIERALNALQYASPFKYEIKEDTIFIK